MKLYDLIKSNNWLSVELTLLRLYADQEKMLDGYRNVFEKLIITEPREYELEIVLTECDSDPIFEGDKDTYVEVSGRKKIPDPDSITESYSLEFLEWDKWLGMDLAAETIQNFSDLEIIAHCLYEMTFISFDEEEIQEQLKSLNDSVEEFNKLTDEEKKQNTISLEEFKRRLSEENDSN
jgi:hypothetical protein